MSEPFDWLDAELDQLRQQQLLRTLRTRGGPQGATVTLDGRTLLNFGSNDYLGLAADPRLVAAATAAIQAEGVGSGASPLVSGRGEAQRRLEEALATFEGREAALVFPAGFAANAATVAALVDRSDAIFADAKNHASLIDGCRLSRAVTHIYRHADCGHLEELLREDEMREGVSGMALATGCFASPAASAVPLITRDSTAESRKLIAGSLKRRKLIVTDGLFSMDGDLAPLREIADLAERHRCMLLVDEAHATGVFGVQGRGVAEHLGVDEAVHIKIGTLSKALGSSGGFVAGSRRLIDWLANRARGYVFSTAPLAAACAAATTALEIVRNEPERRRQLLLRAENLRGALAAAGYDTRTSQSPIVPIRLGSPERTMRLSSALLERGIFVPGIRPPTVPEGESLLRISLTCGHTPEMIDRLIASLRDSASCAG